MKKGSTKQKKRKKGGGGEEDRMKNRKEKKVGIKYLHKRNYCAGTEPSELVYIGILVTSVMVAQWLVHLLHKQKVRGSFPINTFLNMSIL